MLERDYIKRQLNFLFGGKKYAKKIYGRCRNCLDAGLSV